MARLLPTDSDATLSDKIRVLDRARMATYSYALRQMDHVHPILAGWRTAFAHIGESGKIGIPDRPSFGITHDMLSELLLARIITVGVEDSGLPRRGTETAGGPRSAVARGDDIHRRVRVAPDAAAL